MIGGAVIIARLRARLTLMRQILQEVDQGICALDKHNRIVYWNDRLQRLCGSALGELRNGLSLGQHLSSSLGGTPGRSHRRAALSHELLRALSRRRNFSTEIELESGDILHSRGTLIGANGLLITCTDIGDLKRSQLAFRDLATRLAATLDNVLDGIITIDGDGIIESFSCGAEQLLGYSAGEVIGTSMELMMPEVCASIRDGDVEERPAGITRGVRLRREVDARKKNGQLVPIEAGISEVRVGGSWLFIVIVRDITERRRIERLQQEFIATVSHELRTPLTSIIGSLGMMQIDGVDALPAATRRLLQIAEQNCERLQRLIDDILDSVKTNIEALEIALESQPINKLVAATIENNLAFAARFNVRLQFRAEPEDVIVRVDASRLQQVLTNLISNAVKFSRPGEVVEVRLAREHESAVISVIDHGAGIAEDFRARIFQKFSQADSSDARLRGGTGLGLYIARKLITRMGGLIDFDSEVGVGTTFKVHLPLQSAAAPVPHDERHLLAVGAS